MLTIGIIGSGSNGNSFIFENNDFSFVIDNGFPVYKFIQRAEDLDLKVQKIKILLLTHSHIDHISGVYPLSRKLSIPLFLHKNLKSSHLKKYDVSNGYLFEHNKTYSFHNDRLKVYPFATFHDSNPSSGFYLKIDTTKVLYLTDTGTFNDEMVKLACHSQIIFLESNYDPDMLLDGPYPFFLKKRIQSSQGHLSNIDVLDFIGKIIKSMDLSLVTEKNIYLGHLSKENNSPEKVHEKIQEKFHSKISKENNSEYYIQIKAKKLILNIFIITRDTPYKFKINPENI